MFGDIFSCDSFGGEGAADLEAVEARATAEPVTQRIVPTKKNYPSKMAVVPRLRKSD